METIKQIRNSEVAVYKACRQRWHWNFTRCLQPATSHPALRFGNLTHRSLEAYYIPGTIRGPHPAETFTLLYEDELERQAKFGVRDDEKWIEAGELGPAMLEHYVDHWKEDHGSQPADKHLEILVPELPFTVTLRHPKTGRKYVQAVGKLDAVVKDLRTKRIGLMDHKTAASINTGYLSLDEQAGHYFAFAPTFLRRKGLLKKEERISHIMYNFLRKAMPDARPRNEHGQRLNKDGSVSKRQPPDFFLRERVWRSEADRKELTSRLINTHWEMEQVRKGKLPILKTPGRDCPRCPFKDPCELHESGADYEEMLKLAYVPWNPYSDYEILQKG